MKSLRITFLTLLTIFVVPVSTFASTVSPLGPGEWDPAGQRIFYGDHSNNPVYSGGGDFMIRMIQIPNPSGTTYKLYEYDPNNADDYVGQFTFRASDVWWTLRGIGNYVDGSNGKAEFYLKTSNSSKVSNFVFYD